MTTQAQAEKKKNQFNLRILVSSKYMDSMVDFAILNSLGKGKIVLKSTARDEKEK